MTVFEVWAPKANRVTVTIETQGENLPVPMEQLEGGWWTANVPSAGTGTDYRFTLDDQEPLPDPRSLWQPGGIFGPSRVVDHSLFAWSDAGFRSTPLSSAIFYELHVGTFTPVGTFDAVLGRLDYLTDLGITHVELMPVHQFPGERGWSYDGANLFAPQASYGGPDGLKRLVDACHGRGLGVVLDVVLNHLGPAGNYLGRFGPYFTDHYETPWGPAVNLDGPGSDQVRRFLCDNALMWLRDYHCDGLRLDAVDTLIDASAIHILEQLAREVDDLEAVTGRPLILVGETALNDPRLIRPVEAFGYGLDAQWNDEFHHALHTQLTGERQGYYMDFAGGLADVAHSLEHAYVYDGRYSRFRDHTIGRSIGELSGHHFVAFIQNHDQVGNRAQGERMSRLVRPDLLAVAAALVLTAPFIPLLFQGEEWGASSPFLYFTDHHQQELGQAVTEGRRAQFVQYGWTPDGVPDPQERETMMASQLNWDEMYCEPHTTLLAWYRALIQLRRNTPSLLDGNFGNVRTQFNNEQNWLLMDRGAFTIACNFSDRRREIVLPFEGRSVLLASKSGCDFCETSITLPGHSAAIVGPVDGGVRNS